MLNEIMHYLHNYFTTPVSVEGEYSIEGGALSLPFVKDGQYILIEGSNFNDGAYVYPLENATDESFNGCVTVLSPPDEFIKLCNQIGAYVDKEADLTGLQSESFGGYSYTRATNANGGLADWQDVFRERLNAWRKI